MKKMPKRFTAPALLATFLAVAIGHASAVQAHGGATGVVKERMDVMSTMGKRMKAVGDMLKGKVPFDPAGAAEAGRFIGEAAPKLSHLFPDGSLEEPSEALPAVWKERERFEALIEDLAAEAKKLAEVSEGGDRAAILRQFSALGEVCSACHTDFRMKKEE